MNSHWTALNTTEFSYQIWSCPIFLLKPKRADWLMCFRLLRWIFMSLFWLVCRNLMGSYEFVLWWCEFSLSLILLIIQSLIGWPCYVIVHVCLQLFMIHLVTTLLFKRAKVIRLSTCYQVVSMWPVYLVWRVILYTVWFCMATVFIWSISGPLFYGSNLYVIGKENVLSLLSVIFVLCNRVQSSKITSYFELFWTKYFQFGWQNVSTYFSTFFKTDWQIFCIFTEY